MRLIVPDHFHLEVANGLRSSVLRRQIETGEAHNSLSGVLELRVEAIRARDLASDALRFALDHGITPYDAAYAILALRRSATLVTADSGLARAAQSAGVDTTLIEVGAQ